MRKEADDKEHLAEVAAQKGKGRKNLRTRREGH